MLRLRDRIRPTTIAASLGAVVAVAASGVFIACTSSYAVPKTTLCDDSGAGAAVAACTSFDDGNDFPTGWTKDIKVAGTLNITDDDAVSAPHSLSAFVPGHDGGNPYQLLSFQTTGGSGKFAIDFDFKASVDLAATDPAGLTSFTCIFEVYTDNAPNAQICFGKTYLGATIETYAEDGGAPGRAHVTLLTQPPPLDTWHHVHAEFSFLAGDGGISVRMDGQNLGATEPGRTLELKKPTGNVTVELGVDSSGHFGDARIHFDNVILVRL